MTYDIFVVIIMFLPIQKEKKKITSEEKSEIFNPKHLTVQKKRTFPFERGSLQES